MKVPLPPGCSGIDAADGTKYTASRPGGTVEVSDRHAQALRRSKHQKAGLLDGKERFFLGTRDGRWCRTCRRLWNAWSAACPRCGAETEPEAV